MFRNIILAGVVLVLVGCGKPAGLRAVNVKDGGGTRSVVVVQDYKWRIVDKSGTIWGGTKVTQDNNDQWHFENFVEPADQKAYDTVFEYLKGRPPLKAD